MRSIRARCGKIWRGDRRGRIGVSRERDPKARLRRTRSMAAAVGGCVWGRCPRPADFPGIFRIKMRETGRASRLAADVRFPEVGQCPAM